MENQEELKIGIGDEEVQRLQPEDVKIENVRIEEVGSKGAKKLVCEVLHPAAEGTINISEVKYENNGQLKESGLWLNKDSQGLIRKGSALAVLLTFKNSANISELKDKVVSTALDSKGYLCFKCY